MPKLNPDLAAPLPGYAQRYASQVDLSLPEHPDGMLLPGGDQHYFSVGASALNVVLAAVSLAQVAPKSILDFGCGAGRVTRWLRAAFPDAQFSACDMRDDDLLFVAKQFVVTTWRSATSVTELEKPHAFGFDLIWVGSVITHLDRTTSIALLDILCQWLNPMGLLIASVHGRTARVFGDTGRVKYISPEAWQKIRSAYDATGYGYADYDGQIGYGISLASPEWTVALGDHLELTRVVCFGEALWDSHHDVVTLQKVTNGASDVGFCDQGTVA